MNSFSNSLMEGLSLKQLKFRVSRCNKKNSGNLPIGQKCGTDLEIDNYLKKLGALELLLVVQHSFVDFSDYEEPIKQIV